MLCLAISQGYRAAKQREQPITTSMAAGGSGVLCHCMALKQDWRGHDISVG